MIIPDNDNDGDGDGGDGGGGGGHYAALVFCYCFLLDLLIDLSSSLPLIPQGTSAANKNTLPHHTILHFLHF